MSSSKGRTRVQEARRVAARQFRRACKKNPELSTAEVQNRIYGIVSTRAQADYQLEQETIRYHEVTRYLDRHDTV
jgi:hypothetical protein